MARGDFSEALLDALPGVFYLYDQHFHFLRWNRELERVTGRTAADMATVSPLELFDGPERELVANRIREVFEVGASSVEAHLVSTDGSRTPFFFTGRRTEFDGRMCLIGVGIDITQRLQAEDALRKAEYLLSAAERLSHTGAWTRDLTTGAVQWSAETYRIMGVPLGTPIEEAAFLNLVREDDRAAVIGWIAECLARRTAQPIEFRIQRGGDERLLEAELGVADADSPRQAKLIGIVRDVTEAREATRRLRESDERLRLATAAARLGTFDWDVPRDRIVWSRRHEELWGFAPGEFGGTYAAFAARVHPDDLAAVNAEVERCIAARAPFAAEFRVRWPDGTILWVHGRGEFAFDAAGRPQQMLGVVMDVTERRRAEEALRDSEQRFRTVVDQAADAIVIANASGGYDHCNAAACTLFGYSRDEFLSLPLVALVVADQQPKAAITAAGTVSGHAQASVWQFQRKDGSTFIGEAHVNRLPDDRLIAVIRDVTERHRAEGQLRDYAVSLRALTEHLERVRDEEATRIARELHDELGQQLTGLRIDLGWLSKHLPERDPHASAEPVQHRIGEMIRHIDQTIHTVRRISTDLRPAILDDLGLCAAVEWQAEEFARRTGLQCSARVPPDEISIGRPAAAAMFRILREALTNVVRHAGAGRVDIVLEQIGAAVRLRISDNGRGLAPDAIGSRSLGLLGMRERAEAHGGSVRFDRPPQGGTTVIVELPI